jgi:EmrB/QacA subfamily drug resistance transporter
MGVRETRRWPVLVLMCVAQFVNVLDVTVVLVALPSIGRDLNLPPHHLQWVVSAYALLFAGFLLQAGRAADLFGRRRTFMSGLALFAAASLVCGLAGSPEVLIFGRAAQGLGAAITAPAALSIITTTFPDGGERDRALGVWTAVAAGGGAAGFVLGGLITDGLGWEWVFLVNVPVAALGLALTPALIPESRDDGAPRRLDLLGAVTITAGLVALVYGLTRVEESGFGSLSVFGTLALAAALIWTFFLVEGRATNPLVPLRVFRSSNVVGANLVASVLTATTSPIGVLLTLYLQRVLDLSPTAAGLTYLPFSLSVVAGSFIGSRLTGSVGAQATMVSGLVFVAAASLILGGISAGGGFARLPVCLMLSGSGLGCASVASTALGTSAAREGEQGLASGLLNTSAQVGTALGLAALTTIATARSEVLMSSGEATAAALVGGFGVAFYTGAGLAVAGACAALLLVRDKWGGR